MIIKGKRESSPYKTTKPGGAGLTYIAVFSDKSIIAFLQENAIS
jgi:hypothetical protein